MLFIKKTIPFFCFYLIACSQSKTITSDQIIEQSISACGWNQKEFSISFDFRDYTYKLIRKPFFYSYQRSKLIEGTAFLDIMTSKDQLKRYKNNRLLKLNDSITNLYSNSLNSVMYFFQLPLILRDDAVISEVLGATTIFGKKYWSVKVLFNQSGGGKDFKDEYRYWIDQESHLIAFLAYNYLTDGGGTRFRIATNYRKHGGILFQDYINYKPKLRFMSLDSLPILLEKGNLIEISKIKNKNIMVFN
jgi:hypothetical protein